MTDLPVSDDALAAGLDSFTFTASCPGCGGLLLPGAQTTSTEVHVAYETRCDHCLDLYRIDVTATLTEPWPVNRCDPEARITRGRAGAAEGLSPLTSLKGAAR